MDTNILGYSSPINNNQQASGVRSVRAPSAFQLEQLNAKLQQWVDAASPGSAEDREVAKSRMMDVYIHRREQLDLSGLGLTTLPEDVFFEFNIKNLDLKNNQFRELREHVFSGLSNLEVLNFRGNQLSTFSENTFSNLTHLQHLDLEENQLSDIPTQIYGLSRDCSVDINYNCLSMVALKELLSRVQAPIYDGPKINFMLDAAKQRYSDFSLSQSESALPVENALSLQQKLTCLESKLQEWVDATPVDSMETRTVAKDRIIKAYRGNEEKLTLAGLELSTLPEGIFSELKIKELEINDNALSELSERFFSELPNLLCLSISFNRLTALPENAFVHLTQLQYLDISGNELGALPKNIFAGLHNLQRLDMVDMKLESIPKGMFDELRNLKNLQLDANKCCALPADLFSALIKLEHLGLSDNELYSIHPNAFSGLENLQVLDLYGNELRALPEKVFEGLPKLKQVQLNYNQLRGLPENCFIKQTALKILCLNQNELLSLPNDILTLPRGCTVYLENNFLLSNERESLRARTQVANYQGPQFIFSMADAQQEEIDIPLNKIVKEWFDGVSLPFSEEAETAWQAINDESSAQSFAQFLAKLIGRNVNNSSDLFKNEVVKWLERLGLEENQGLRELIFPIALEGLGSCEDRVSLIFNKMKNAEVIFDVNRGTYDNKLDALIALARQQFRLDALEKIAAAKVETLYMVDPIEVYLAYQVQLSVELGLELGANKMLYFDFSYVQKDDLQTAALQVKQDENKNFKHYFAAWEPWSMVLKRKAPEAYQQLQNDIYSASEKYCAEQTTMQLKDGTSADTEANRLTREEAVTRALAVLESEHQVKATEKFLEKQNALLEELNKQIWFLQE